MRQNEAMKFKGVTRSRYTEPLKYSKMSITTPLRSIDCPKNAELFKWLLASRYTSTPLCYTFLCCRKYEYPERDVPHHQAAAATVIDRSGSAAVVGRSGSAVDSTVSSSSSLHVTNLVIDKTPTRSSHNLNLILPAGPQKVRGKGVGEEGKGVGKEGEEGVGGGGRRQAYK
jgi:hypothetical protein